MPPKTTEEKIKGFILDKLGYEYEEDALFGDYAGGLVELDTLFTTLRKETEEAVAEARRERLHILKVIDGYKEVYQENDERFYSEAKDGEEKEHIDSERNEVLDEIIKALTPPDTK